MMCLLIYVLVIFWSAYETVVIYQVILLKVTSDYFVLPGSKYSIWYDSLLFNTTEI